jgi:hypothetical protein
VPALPAMKREHITEYDDKEHWPNSFRGLKYFAEK